MHLVRIAISAALLASLPGCGLDTFDVHASGRSTVDGSIAGGVLDAVPLQLDGLTSFDITSSREFKNQGAKPGDIDSVKLTSLGLAVEAPANGNLDFIDHVDFYASAPGQKDVLIATLDVPTKGVRTVHAKVLDVELKPYATATSMTLSSKVKGRQPHEDTTVRVDVVISVDVAIGPF
jgi:hypothetical protein